MKMYALYTVSDIPNLEYNHRRYCEKNQIEYNKIFISNSLSEKYSNILACLQKNIGKVLFFIDNFTYFKIINHVPKLVNDVHIQKDNSVLIDNFFIVKSTEKTISIFEQALQSINSNGFQEQRWKNVALSKNFFPDDFCLKYPYQEDEKIYTNLKVYAHLNVNDINNVLCLNFTNHYLEKEGAYFAEIVCNSSKKQNQMPTNLYECFNPGKKVGFVTQYTPNISDVGAISEENIKKYCLNNDITYHIYRDIPQDLKIKNIGGAWTKPWLLLNHFNSHENLAWIDSDILIARNYVLNTADDIVVYKDPYFKFNSGYMMFKTIEKNKQLLLSVAEKIQKIDGPLEGVYKHGGDQPRFIETVLEFYPNYSPLSALLGNTHPVYPISISPYKTDVMLHFMGFEKQSRLMIMQGYNEIMSKEYEK